MKTKLVLLDKPIIVSDEEIRLDDWYLDDVCEIRQSIMYSDSEDYWAEREKYQKIIAGLDNLPEIDFNGLEGEFYSFTIKDMKEAMLLSFDTFSEQLSRNEVETRIELYLNNLNENKVFDIDIETEEYDHDEDWSEISGAFEICKYRPKVTNNKIKILKKL